MDQGKKRRMQRIFQQDNRTVIVPMDHGVTIGPCKGLVSMQKTVDQLHAADAILVHRGLAKHLEVGPPALIVHLSGADNLSPNPNKKVQVCSVQEAIRQGADGVSLHINVGAQEDETMLAMLGKVADECELYGMPLLAMMYPRGPKITDEHAPELVAHVARLGAELGADIIKCNYTGDIVSFRNVVESCCGVPVIIAGGPKAKTEVDIFEMTIDALKAGGSGVSIGRNVFQHQNQAAMVKALSAIVHKGVPASEAMKVLGGKS